MEKGKKYIHYCWFGNKKLSRLAKKCIKSWKKYFPEYEIICWNEKNTDLNECAFIKEAYENKKWAFVADYARAKAINEYGGIYFDTDVLIKKDMHDIVEKGSFLGVEDSGAVNACVWGANKSGDWISTQLVNFYKKQKHFPKNDLYSITIPLLITNFLEEKGFNRGDGGIQKIEDMYIYPREYFCPLSYNYQNNIFTQNTRAIHYYDASWTPKEEQRTINLIRRFGENRANKILTLRSKIGGVARYYYGVVKNTAKLILFPIRFLREKKRFNKKFEQDFAELTQQINAMKNKNYIVFYNKEWLGTSSAAKNLFGDHALGLPDYFNNTQMETIADLIASNNVKGIIFSAFTDVWGKISEKIKCKNPKIIIKVYWQGSNAMHIEDYDWGCFANVFRLLNNKTIDSIIFAKKSMYEQYKQNGYDVEFLPNTANVDVSKYDKRDNEDGITKVGIYASGDRWVKNFYNQLAAVSLIPKTKVSIIPISQKVKDFARILRMDVTGIDDVVDHEELLENIANQDIVLNVSFTECAPITPLECLELGVICITGPNHHYWENEELEEYLIEPKVDNPIAIAERIKKCLDNKEKILTLYRKWKKNYDKECIEVKKEILKRIK